MYEWVGGWVERRVTYAAMGVAGLVALPLVLRERLRELRRLPATLGEDGRVGVEAEGAASSGVGSAAMATTRGGVGREQGAWGGGTASGVGSVRTVQVTTKAERAGGGSGAGVGASKTALTG